MKHYGSEDPLAAPRAPGRWDDCARKRNLEELQHREGYTRERARELEKIRRSAYLLDRETFKTQADIYDWLIDYDAHLEPERLDQIASLVADRQRRMNPLRERPKTRKTYRLDGELLAICLTAALIVALVVLGVLGAAGAI